MFLFLVPAPLLLAFQLLHLWHWDLSFPLYYSRKGQDDLWQMLLSKTLVETGWIFDNPSLGAPDAAHWYLNSAGQTSPIHSLIFLALSPFNSDPIFLQQLYFVINFPLIAMVSYAVCRSVGVDRLLSICVGFAFAFTHYRILYSYLMYLPNYFAVPIALLPPLWVIGGEFVIDGRRAEPPSASRDLRKLLTSPIFGVAVLLCILTAVSDGYYAFFGLLLLGFATVLRLLRGDLRRPLSLVAPFAFGTAIVATVLALSMPLAEYRNLHPQEASQDQLKFPAEAEVYSASLKLLVAPPLNHRIPLFREVGQRLVDSSNFNRVFPGRGGTPASLGTLPVSFLVFVLALLCAPISAWPRALAATVGQAPVEREPFLWIIGVMGVFILLCSTSGGIGSLIAFAYPTIRAYERFPIFLIFLLYLGAAFAVTRVLEEMRGSRRLALQVLVVAISGLAVLDQVPHDPYGLSTDTQIAARSELFRAEGDFVHQIETELPDGALVYQYPYSQFLTDSKYYGWASYGQCRLYLHSQRLRWDGCATRGSPVDRWHTGLAALPTGDLVTELRAVGFAGFVLDEGVLSDEENQRVRETLVELAGQPSFDSAAAKLAFWKLPPLNYRIEYNPEFTMADRLVVFDRTKFEAGTMTRMIDATVLSSLLCDANSQTTFERRTAPSLFNGPER